MLSKLSADELESWDENELRNLLLNLDALSQQENKDEDKPKTDDELHAYIKNNLGIDIPRVAVCADHNAPFEPIADLFFKRIMAAIVVANRGGGKTDDAAVWQF